jgi:hypothetical protein
MYGQHMVAKGHKKNQGTVDLENAEYMIFFCLGANTLWCIFRGKFRGGLDNFDPPLKIHH